MDDYFESLLNEIHHEKETDNETIIAEAQTDGTVEPLNNSQADDLQTNESKANSSTDDSTPSKTSGGDKLDDNHILIYSFIHPLVKSLKTYNIRDLTPDLMKIVIDIHKKLPNDFVKPKDITQQIISSLVELIKSDSDQFKIFFLPALPICSTFNLTKIVHCKELSEFSFVLINPSFKLMMKQIINDYKESTFRLTVNQDLSYILKNYNSTNEETTHSVSYSLQDLKNTMNEIKSAFIDENDFNESIDIFHQSLISDSNSNILFSHISKFKNIFDMNDTTQSTLDELSKFLSEERF